MDQDGSPILRIVEQSVSSTLEDVPYADQTEVLAVSNSENSNGLKRPRARNTMSWEDMFDLLIQYGVDHGDHNVPKSLVVYLVGGAVVNLGEWLKLQRKQKRAGRLTAPRESKLQTLVDGGTLFWNSNRSANNEDTWERNFNSLLEFGKVHHHCNVPSSYSSTNAEEILHLGAWLRDQRKSMRANTMGAKRASKLQKLVDDGLLSWGRNASTASSADEWGRCFDYLLAYGEKNGNLNVPSEHTEVFPEDGTVVCLGKWLHDQRQAHWAGTLSTEARANLQPLVDQGKLSWEDELDVFMEGAYSAEPPSERAESCTETAASGLHTDDVTVHAKESKE